MKQECPELRELVSYLAQTLQAEQSQAGSGRQVGNLPAPQASAIQSESPGRVTSSAATGNWKWQEWSIAPVDGGMNNRLFRATAPAADVAIKFTMRDARDRAGREWAALKFLAEHAPDLAPHPILLDRSSYAHQVIVQSWLAGDASASLPANDPAWHALCQHLLKIHSLPASPDHPAIHPVVLYVTSPADALQAIRAQHSRLSPEEWAPGVNDLITKAHSAPWPHWPQPPLRFCRGDPNIRNFIRRANAWASVDWEYSGWGDPAFEIADFLVHAAHIEWPRQQTRRLVDLYSASSSDPTITQRIAVYETLMLVWWTLRLGRILPEARSGRDKRLVTFSQTWLEERRSLQMHYQQLAEAALSSRTAFQ